MKMWAKSNRVRLRTLIPYNTSLIAEVRNHSILNILFQWLLKQLSLKLNLRARRDGVTRLARVGLEGSQIGAAHLVGLKDVIQMSKDSA